MPNFDLRFERITSRHTLTVASLLFAAGAVGGVVNYFLPILVSYAHIPSWAHVDINPRWDKAELYHKVVWGGLWGFIILLRLRISNWWGRATVYGLFPTLVQLFIIFPETTSWGWGGLGLGNLTPLFVFFYNTVGWSWPACLWLHLAGWEDSTFDYESI